MYAKTRERRARKNTTLEAAACEIGISAKTLRMIENEQILSIRKTDALFGGKCSVGNFL
ncbi:hypothetical protein D920_00778 [Enterococcus faecalis 13-SD-W-01]|nr:hypothetical protein D920_00778 [Enterococcus faecalis 13-SD-W-01]